MNSSTKHGGGREERTNTGSDALGASGDDDDLILIARHEFETARYHKKGIAEVIVTYRKDRTECQLSRTP